MKTIPSNEIKNIKIKPNSIIINFNNGKSELYESKIESDTGIFTPCIKLREITNSNGYGIK